MVKSKREETLKIVEKVKKTLSELYLKREQAKENVKSNKLTPRIREVVLKFNQKLKLKEDKLKKRIFAEVAEEQIRAKILQKLKKGLDRLRISEMDEKKLDYFINEMTDYNMHTIDLNLDQLVSDIKETRPPMQFSQNLFKPRVVLPRFDEESLDFLNGWPPVLMISKHASKFRADFIINMTQFEKQRLRLMTQQGVIQFLQSGANYENGNFENNFNLKIEISAFELKYDAIKYLGNRIYFDPIYMKAVRNLFMTYGLKIFFNHNEYPLRINFLKSLNLRPIDPNIVKNLIDCGLTVSYGHEKKSIFVLGTIESESKARLQSF